MGKEETDYFRELGPSGRNLTPSTHIGISSLPDQFVNLQLKRGFTFNIMCIGTSGIGKTSLLHTLFRRPFVDEPHTNRSEDVSITTHQYDMQEGGVNMKVNFIETKGYGDQINKVSSTKSIISYINSQYEKFLTEETKIRRNIEPQSDTRVHVVIYMINPTGHSLNILDVMVMKELQSKVNLIPVIGKADILTKNELKEFKTKILNDLKENGINFYHFPLDDSHVFSRNAEMNDKMPFAVVASAEEETINGQLCRVRKYPWGTVIVDDDMHCEFLQLREMLLRSNLHDLIRNTHHKFYENYRTVRFTECGIPQDTEMSESLKKKRSEIMISVERQIDDLKAKYERDFKGLEENYKRSEQELVDKFNNNLKILEERKNEYLSLLSQNKPTDESESNDGRIFKPSKLLEMGLRRIKYLSSKNNDAA